MEQVIRKYIYKAHFKHLRTHKLAVDAVVQIALKLGQIKLHAHGYCRATAVTICVLRYENGKKASSGYAFCSEDDNFSRKKGRDIAMSRAIQWLGRSNDEPT